MRGEYIQRLHAGQTVICLAPGPSLIPADIDACAGHTIIAINTAWRLCPDAYRYSSDWRFWRHEPEAVTTADAGLCIGLAPLYNEPAATRVRQLEPAPSAILSRQPTHLATGGHSGYAAINLAFHLGAARIILLGYDMMPALSGDQHAAGCEPLTDRHPRYAQWLNRYGPLVTALAAQGVELMNATRQTAIPAADVPRVSMEAVLCLLSP